MVSEKIMDELIRFTKEEIIEAASSEESSFTAKAYVIKEDEIDLCAMLPFADDEEKILMIESIGEIAQQQGYKQIVLVVDTYYRKAQTSEEREAIFGNWETEQPRAYPESMRQSAAILLTFDMGQKKGFQAYFLPYRNVDGNMIFEEIELNESSNGVLYEAMSNGYIKAILKETLNFQKMSDETKEGKDPFDAMADNMAPLISRIIDDYPFFHDTQAMENLQLLASPSGRILAKENFMRRFESGEEGDFL